MIRKERERERERERESVAFSLIAQRFSLKSVVATTAHWRGTLFGNNVQAPETQVSAVNDLWLSGCRFKGWLHGSLGDSVVLLLPSERAVRA